MTVFEEPAWVEGRFDVWLGIEGFSSPPHPLLDRALLFLQELSARGVDLVTVPIEGNMASCDHDAALALREGIAGQCRCRDATQVDWFHPGVLNSAHDSLSDLAAPALALYIPVGTRPQVIGEVEQISADDPSL